MARPAVSNPVYSRMQGTANCTPMQDKTGHHSFMGRVAIPMTIGITHPSLSGMLGHNLFQVTQCALRHAKRLVLLASQLELRQTLRTGHACAIRSKRTGIATSQLLNHTALRLLCSVTDQRPVAANANVGWATCLRPDSARFHPVGGATCAPHQQYKCTKYRTRYKFFTT